MKLRLFFICCFFAHFLPAFGNNVKVSNVQIIAANKIGFKISWENSWNLTNIDAPGNYDAVWVFVKYREANSIKEWKHLGLENSVLFHSAQNQLEIETVTDGKGVFLKRKNTGTGSVSDENIMLQWAGFLPAGNYDFKVFAIEMVWIPEGSFYAGDAASQSRFRRGDVDLPFHISSEEKILPGKDSAMLSDTGKFAPEAEIPASYPKGFKGFYCMKYEVSQQQYADFLNCLNYNQQQKRTANPPSSIKGNAAMSSSLTNRSGIVIIEPGEAFFKPAIYGCNAVNNNAFNDADDGQARACNFLNWADLAAYLDWAALRPITEFEFEKICRGPLEPVKHEFAWGTDKVTDANTPKNDGTENEAVTEIPADGFGLASHGYIGPQGPLRNGFAALDSTNRLQAGAAYFGAMEMSGNLWEICITVNEKGLKFTGNSGNGNLNENGDADVENWPAANGIGAGYRGGAWNSGILPEFRDLAISDRFYSGLTPNTRRNTNGGRGGR